MERLFAILSALSVLLLSAQAGAEICTSVRQQINGKSWHFGNSDEDFNEWNPGIGIVCDNGDHMSLLGGIYKNSYNKDSVYAGFGVHARFGDDFHIDPGVLIMAATNYPKKTYFEWEKYDRTIEVGYAYIAIGYKDDFRLNIGVAPGSIIDERTSTVVFVNFEIPIYVNER